MSTQTEAEVIATVRSPDGDNRAAIDGVVIRRTAPNGGYPILDRPEAVRWAEAGLLWTHIPGDGRAVDVVPVDQDRDGQNDYVRTKPDATVRNNLLDLPIWDRRQQVWLDPASGRQVASP